MKRFLSVLLVFIIMLFCFCGCNNEKTKAQTNESLYKKFIVGDITAVNKDGKECNIDSFVLGGELGEDYTYTFLDMNGDDLVEICIKKYPEMYFFTVKDGKVYHWYTDNNAYSRLLNNGAFLYERHGGAPEHINYKYYELDKHGSVKFQISFSWWGSTTMDSAEYDEEYFVDETQVTKEVFQEKTNQYLNIGDDKILWYDKNGKQVSNNQNSDKPTSQEYESLTDKYTREIGGAYKEENKLPDSSTTFGMIECANKYTAKWKEVADEYYNKLIAYDDMPPIDELHYYSSDDLHSFVSNMKTNWEQYYKTECENYYNTMRAIYGPGTIVGPLCAFHEYELQMNWALEILDICDQLGIE